MTQLELPFGQTDDPGHHSTLAELQQQWAEYSDYLRWAEELAEHLPGVVEGFISDHGGHGRIEGELTGIEVHRIDVEGDAMGIEQWFYRFEAAAYDLALGYVRRGLPDRPDLSDTSIKCTLLAHARTV